MITIEDCIGLSDLREDEILALAEHEHIPEIAATALGAYLLHQKHGAERIRAMIEDDIRARMPVAIRCMQPNSSWPCVISCMTTGMRLTPGNEGQMRRRISWSRSTATFSICCSDSRLSKRPRGKGGTCTKTAGMPLPMLSHKVALHR